jgi:hypothetical protein
MRIASLLPSATEMDGLEILGAIVSGTGRERLPAESVARM